MILVRYTPRLNDLVNGDVDLRDATLGSATWSAYLRFDHTHAVTSNLDLRRALAHAIDRERLAAIAPANLVVATGGVVPPALQGHTPDIALQFDPDLAREHMERSGFSGELEVAGMEVWGEILAALAETWGEVFAKTVTVRDWSWRAEEATQLGGRADTAYLRITGWFPGYADPEYFLRLLFQSDSRTNEGGFSYGPFDELIERARTERSDRRRLELLRSRPDGCGRPRRVHPARLRTEHGVRQAVDPRLVGVRQVVLLARRPDRGSLLSPCGRAVTRSEPSRTNLERSGQ